MYDIGFAIIVFAAVLYIARRWKQAVEKRDVDRMLNPLQHPGKKQSAFRYLFK